MRAAAARVIGRHDFRSFTSRRGTLVQAGEGRFPPEEVTTMQDRHDCSAAGMNAPAHGLVLWQGSYPKRHRIT